MSFSSSAGQSYEKVVRMCKEKGCLFEDPGFTAEPSSLFFSRAPPKPFQWMRPTEMSSDPQYISSGASRVDVNQGMLGDSWLLAALGSLTCNPALLNRVIVPEQSFQKGCYYGAFKFNFWHQGDWVEVVVDDRLPTYNGKLVFMHSSDSNEFWCALLEKAYAKLNGGTYEGLKGGCTSEAMVDFTGGVVESIKLKDNTPGGLDDVMLHAAARQSLMSCIVSSNSEKFGEKLQNGLVQGHCYSVTSIKKVRLPKSNDDITLVRIRNPWGNEREWTGDWSDRSQTWHDISDEEKRNMGLVFQDDGEFWMSFSDWKANFDTLEICNMGPDSVFQNDESKIRWEAIVMEGKWVRRVSAGGCRNYSDTFACNPQYRIVLDDSDDDDELCTILICLLQKDRRIEKRSGRGNLTIGYTIYKAASSATDGPLERDFFLYNASEARCPEFNNSREVYGRHQLPPGTYVVIPSTYKPDEEGSFLLRIFTEKSVVSSEMDEANTDIIENQDRQIVSEADKTKYRGFFALAREDKEVDVYELQNALNKLFTKELPDGISLEACRSIVAMHDDDRSGKLGPDEFMTTINDLREWLKVFRKYDSDDSGTLNSYELRRALGASGFRLRNASLASIIFRYSDKTGQIKLDDFIVLTIRLKTMITYFKSQETMSKGEATLNIDTCVQAFMRS